MRRRKIRKLILTVLLAACIGCGAFIVIKFYSHKVLTLKDQVHKLSASLTEHDLKRVWVPVLDHDLAAGSAIAENDFTWIEAVKDSVPEDILMAFGGSPVLRVGLKAGCYVTEGMVSRDANDMRFRQMTFDFVRIDSAVKSNDMVDVRILFPDGTDYIVLAGKTVDDLSNGIMIKVSEEEILLMDSARVDTLMYDAEVYAAAYVDKELQQIATVNYMPSEAIIELIESNPNILTDGFDYYSADERKRIIERFSTEKGDDM